MTQFLHATILVQDLTIARQFYEETLGLTLADRDLPFAGCWYQIGPVQLHLIVSERVIPDLANTQKWGRNRHLALAITDVTQMQQRLETAGCAYQSSSSGRTALFVSDPDGNLIELLQVE